MWSGLLKIERYNGMLLSLPRRCALRLISAYSKVSVEAVSVEAVSVEAASVEAASVVVDLVPFDLLTEKREILVGGKIITSEISEWLRGW